MNKKQTTSKKTLYLQKAQLEGYKTIKHTEVEFLPGLNIIIGKNGTGKTNLFNFLYHALQLNYEGFLNFKSKLILENDKKIILTASNESFRRKVEENQFLFDIDEEVDFTLSIDGTIANDVKNRKDVYRNLKSSKVSYVNVFIQHGIPSGNLHFVESPESFDIKGGIFDLQNKIKNLNTPDFIKNIFSALSYNYRNVYSKDGLSLKKNLLDCFNILSSIKYWLVLFSDIDDLRVNDNFNIHYNIATESASVNNLFLEFKINDNWIPFSNLSDGTKRMFYIIAETVFQGKYTLADKSILEVGNYENKIILLEEPELGIHPHQLDKLLEFLKEQAQTKQFIISTHSPIVLDTLRPDELNRILIATLTKEGTQLRRLTEEEMERAKIYMEETGFLSDYWRFSDLEV